MKADDEEKDQEKEKPEAEELWCKQGKSWEMAEVLLAQAVGSSFSLEFTFAS